MMNIPSVINREIFAPREERMLVAIEVRRRNKRKLPFLTPGQKGNYVTFLCLSVTTKKPTQVFVTKVKQFEGSPRFTKRSQWSVEQLRQVNGVNPNKDCPEFDLLFDRSFDQWVASSAAEKCMFVQILYHACQNVWEAKVGPKVDPKGSPGSLQEPRDQQGTMGKEGHKIQEGRKGSKGPRPTDFINCQSKLMGDACSVNMVIYRCKIFLNRMKNAMVSNQGRALSPGSSPSPPAGQSVGSAVHKASRGLSERGERLGCAEEKTGQVLDSAKQFAGTAHKLALKHMN